MAENEDGTEKTEDPTAKKQAKAREEGQVARSKELTTLLTLIASIGGLYFYGTRFLEAMVQIFKDSFIQTRENIFDSATLILNVKDSLTDAIIAIFPFLILLAITGVLASIALGGYNFTFKPLMPKPSKLNPIKGITKIFGKQGSIELIKSALKMGLLGPIMVMSLWSFRDALFYLADISFEAAFIEVMRLIALQFFIVSLGMIVIAAIDVIYQIYTNKQQLKMTKQEVKDENKNTEGNPEIKGRQRSMQRQAAMQRMMSDIPQADVVITNPTHYAVALKYDQEQSGAPKVIAKGIDIVALQVIQVAKGNEVPIVEIPPLSRSIYYHAEIGDEIPAGLYVAVAQVLAFIFQLRSGEIYKGSIFDSKNIEIPDELKR